MFSTLIHWNGGAPSTYFDSWFGCIGRMFDFGLGHFASSRWLISLRGSHMVDVGFRSDHRRDIRLGNLFNHMFGYDLMAIHLAACPALCDLEVLRFARLSFPRCTHWHCHASVTPLTHCMDIIDDLKSNHYYETRWYLSTNDFFSLRNTSMQATQGVWERMMLAGLH